MRTRVWALAAAAVLAAGCGVTPTKASTVAAGQGAAVPPKIGKPFGTFDNTYYKNVNLASFGLTKSNVVYDQRWITQAAQQGRLPDEARFKAYVKAHAKNPGPIVLDLEELYLHGGDSAQVKKNFDVLYAAAKWTHEAAPGHIVGFYGVIGHTDQAYIGLAKQLATRSDAFFPSLYTLFGTNTAPWTNLLKADVAQARKVDPRKPVFVYLWPQYHDGTPKALQFLPAKQWAYELDAAYRYADGFVIWSGSMTPTVPAAAKGWVEATDRFMRAHRNR